MQKSRSRIFSAMSDSLRSGMCVSSLERFPVRYSSDDSENRGNRCAAGKRGFAPDNEPGAVRVHSPGRPGRARRLGMRHISLACAAMVLVLMAGASAARHRGDRQRAIGGWIVDDRAEDDGGRVVELRREAGTVHIRYTAAFWHGNDGRI